MALLQTLTSRNDLNAQSVLTFSRLCRGIDAVLGTSSPCQLVTTCSSNVAKEMNITTPLSSTLRCRILVNHHCFQCQRRAIKSIPYIRSTVQAVGSCCKQVSKVSRYRRTSKRLEKGIVPGNVQFSSREDGSPNKNPLRGTR